MQYNYGGCKNLEVLKMKKKIKLDINKSLQAIKLLQSLKFLDQIEIAIQLIINCLKNKGKIILCGNGGSAAHAQHFAAEYVSKFEKKRRPLPAISLTTDTSILTSISNDFDYKYIFSKQIEALGSKNDILLCYSTSGNSKNIIEAVKIAKKMGIYIISNTGNKKNQLFKYSDLNIKSPSSRTAIIQECQLIVDHIICRTVEEYFSKGKWTV